MRNGLAFAAGAIAGGVLGRAHMRARQRAVEDIYAGLDGAWIDAEATMDPDALERVVLHRCRRCRHVEFVDPEVTSAPICDGGEHRVHKPRRMRPAREPS